MKRRTPFELNYGIAPIFDQLPIGWPCYKPLTAEGRRAHILRQGRPGANRAEPVLYFGKSRGHHRGLTSVTTPGAWHKPEWYVECRLELYSGCVSRY
jgi:hypothetical protein